MLYLTEKEVSMYSGILIVCLIFLFYIIFVFLTFYMMHVYKKKLNEEKKSINIFLYQKGQVITKNYNILKEKDPSFQIDFNFDSINTFKEYETNEFLKQKETLDNLVSKLSKEAVKVKLNGSEMIFKENIDSILEIDRSFNEKVQLYNANIIGYNYWLRYLGTRWIKKIFKVKKIEPIL